MSDSARPRRRYDSTKRRQAAAATRVRIVEAAARLFIEHGYVGTTVPAIAADAEVAVETVYRSATGKAGLLADAVQAALAGGVERAEVPVEERPGIRRVSDETDPRRLLAAWAATQPGLWSRVGPLLRVLAEAKSGDPSLEELGDRLDAQRLNGMRTLAGVLADRGVLREGLAAERAADLIWTIAAQANFDALVTARGWTHAEYREWLTSMLAAALVD